MLFIWLAKPTFLVLGLAHLLPSLNPAVYACLFLCKQCMISERFEAASTSQVVARHHHLCSILQKLGFNGFLLFSSLFRLIHSISQCLYTDSLHVFVAPSTCKLDRVSNYGHKMAAKCGGNQSIENHPHGQIQRRRLYLSTL